jgi:hypothetical protein
MAVKPVTISFKNTTEDMELYSWITKHSNLSGFIKDTLRAEMEKKDTSDIRPETKATSNNLIEFDF